MDHERRAVLAQRVDRGRERAGRVHHDQVAFVEELRQVVRVRVHDAEIAAVRNHHPYRVARDPARLGRSGRFPHGRHHRATSSLAWKRPLTGRSSNRARNAGTTVSGNGRSEMSSPGNAS